jgi:Tol biopolymer transport system component
MRTTFLAVLGFQAMLCAAPAALAGSPAAFTNGIEGDAPAQVLVDTQITLTWSANTSAFYCDYVGSTFPNGVSFPEWPRTDPVCVYQAGGAGAQGCFNLRTTRLRLTEPGSYRFRVNCYSSSAGGGTPVTSTATVAVIRTPTSDGVSLGLVANTPGPVKPGTGFRYTATLRNGSAARLTAPALSLELPAALAAVDNDCGARAANGRLTWSLPNGLPVGDAAACNINVRLTSIPDAEVIATKANVAFTIAEVPFTLSTREETGTSHRARPLSRTLSGAPTTSDSGSPMLSGDGRMLAFASAQAGLVDGDAGGANVLVFDRVTGTRRLLNVDADGRRLAGNASSAAVSLDGKAAAFVLAPASGAAANKADGEGQICASPPNGLYRPACSTRNPSGGLLNGPSESPSLSANGKLLAFCSSASNWVPNDTNGAKDVFVKNLETGAVVRVSTDASGAQADGDSCDPMISGDGAWVAFRTRAPNLGGTADWQVMRKNLANGALDAMSSSADGAPANAETGPPSVSYDGTRIAFASRATNLVAGFTGNFRNVYMADRRDGASEAKGSGGGLFGVRDRNGGPPDGDASDPTISCNGNVIAFGSTATDLVEGEVGNLMDVFAVDPDTGAARRAVAGSSGAAPNGASTNPTLDCEGTTTAFQSGATNLDPADPNGNDDVYGQDDPLRSDPAAVDVDASYSGNWFNPGQSGHGVLIEALPLSGLPFYVTWYLYVNGEPLFLQGVAQAQGNVINVQMYSTRSNGFPIGPGGPVNAAWGSVRVTFTDSNSALFEWFPTLFGLSSGSMNLRRLTRPALVQNDSADNPIKACYSGVWNEAARSGYGFDLEVNDFADGRYLTAYWYTYRPDGSPLWLVGVGRRFGPGIVMDLYEGGGPGAQFPPAFSASAVTQTKWGSATFLFRSNDLVAVSWAPVLPGYAAGSANLQRLTALRGRACE